ncbi:MAG: CDP-glycerol glycerophosphotransferase family protein [Alphaproteobacteria bacterium]|nr:CDP-glycerol glycerophosphotransferase family protein [Alphaproteobacteria bacterium]
MTSALPQETPKDSLATDMKRLENRMSVLEDLLDRAMKENAALGQAVLERAKKDGVRLAVLEAYRIVHTLTRASQFYQKARTVVFVGRSYFGDNIKYAFLSFCATAREKNIDCYFLAYDEAQYDQLKAAGLPCLTPQVARWTQNDAKILMGTSVVVLCDNYHPHYGINPIPYALLQGARFIQLWHGIPLKEIGLQHVFAPGGQNIMLSEIIGSSGFFDVLAATNAASEKDWRRSFGFRDFAPIGYPRNDVFFREVTPQDLMGVDQESFRLVQTARQEGRAVVIYGPTFRDHIGPNWFERARIAELAEYCRANNHVFLINLHPFEQPAVGDLRKLYPAARFIEPHTDVYPIVKYASVFITDYSSLVFDVLLVDCPLVFYRPDHEEYMARARALIPGREGYTPGEVVTDIASLIQAVTAALHSTDSFKEARAALRAKLFDHNDGCAAQRLGEVILKQLEIMQSKAPNT